MQLVSTKAVDSRDTAQWQARIDLAAAHRLAVMQGFSEGIFNHLTLAVPGRTDSFYINPFGLHWSEVTASNLITVSYDGKVLEGDGEVERSAFCIHAPIHRLNRKHAAVLHTHMPYASALTRLDEPQIQAIGQTEIGFLDEIAYDDQYTGLAYDPAEGERLSGVLGDKSILFMANHGVLVCGDSIANVFDDLYYLERAAMVQVLAQSTGGKLRILTDEVAAQTAAQHAQERQQSALFLEALKRRLDTSDPGWSQR
jgi:ribulose-5-phosphate 4-epimerase/fuculose-1-phosphate aldolase